MMDGGMSPSKYDGRHLEECGDFMGWAYGLAGCDVAVAGRRSSGLDRGSGWGKISLNLERNGYLGQVCGLLDGWGLWSSWL
ncbi:protein of unknown function [Methanoculleus bourgensis]|uniref:Uncharacterized protein n=1 Tax=Methanoculleus bourgensis TaxID=83986 RepID=A0A0X8Y0A1_9EURY|nr:protein of unknown function [Methanoculleus bourgensis]